MKTIAVVELGLYERMVPLVGGYLEAYAHTDLFLRKEYRFEKITATPKIGHAQLLQTLGEVDADIYAFSCYVWNTRLITHALADLVKFRPNARIILGGPQVMHCAEQYLLPSVSQVVICNGEGELVFADYLRELTEPAPDLSKVNGISLLVDGTLITTTEAKRFQDLNAIPSPFLSGKFRAEYSTTVFETNRGCPFRCGFCYWGAATNDRVYRFSEERIRDEVTWLAKKRVTFVYIADANWGMSNRDVEISRHFASCKSVFDAPTMIYYSAAKNSPHRVTEVTRLFRAAGIIAAQPISLQTLDEKTLELVDRQNIRTSAYIQVQQNLSELKISSFTELIWPLPGETLISFDDGITVIVYPHLLLHNTPLYTRRAALGLSSEDAHDSAGEAEIVTTTQSVSRSEFDRGMRFFYAVHVLYNARALRCVADYLDRGSISSYVEFFEEFSQFCRTSGSAVAKFIDESVNGLMCYDLFNYGKLIHHVLHAERSASEDLFFDFLSSRPYWSDQNVRFLAEVDRILKPYVYSSTPMSVCGRRFEIMTVAVRERGYDVSIPAEFRTLFTTACRPFATELADNTLLFHLNHRRAQYPYMRSQGLEHNAGYCFGMIVRIDNILPLCEPLERGTST